MSPPQKDAGSTSTEDAPAAPMTLRFPLLLFAWLGGIGLLLSTVLLPWYTALHQAMSVATAGVVHSIIGLLGSSTRTGRFVTYDGFAVEIVGECLGLYEILIFAAAVLAYPATWRQRGQGLVLGTAIILVFNLVRIVALLLVGRHLPGLFEFFHLYFWQGTLVLLIAAAWLAWLRWVVRR
jgi:exosortase H (IPTLxxWG-CTERM-specific)